MNEYLLDTHTLVWVFEGDAHVSRRVAQMDPSRAVGASRKGTFCGRLGYPSSMGSA